MPGCACRRGRCEEAFIGVEKTDNLWLLDGCLDEAPMCRYESREVKERLGGWHPDTQHIIPQELLTDLPFATLVELSDGQGVTVRGNVFYVPNPADKKMVIALCRPVQCQSIGPFTILTNRMEAVIEFNSKFISWGQLRAALKIFASKIVPVLPGENSF